MPLVIIFLIAFAIAFLIAALRRISRRPGKSKRKGQRYAPLVLYEQLQNDTRIITESLQIIQSTTSFETLRSRIDLIAKKASALSRAAQTGCPGINKTKTLRWCENLPASLRSVKTAFLARTYQKEITSVSALKTKSARYRRLCAHFEQLHSFQTVFSDVADAYNKALSDLRMVMEDDRPQISDNAISYPENSSGALSSMDAFKSIPKEIIDLLWFENGPLKNVNTHMETSEVEVAGIHINIGICGTTEPSAIDIDLPVSFTDFSSEPLGYYPNYWGLTPEQRGSYLRWLADISAPIDIGYVFLFYYGLERHLFFGNSEAALAAILLLRQFHVHSSFASYSGDAVVLYALRQKRPELIQEMDFCKMPSALRLFTAAITQHKLAAEDLIYAHKNFSFTNGRYIKGEPELFTATLEDLLVDKCGADTFEITLDDIQAAKETFTLTLANYSLLPPQRFLSLPDIATAPRVHDSVNELLCLAHESVKIKLRERRKTMQQGAQK
ncbi:MAG: hypothetical protein HFE43_08265 [Oscillospiraceae bacterium]|jgi:hypothetical protein|nr:hypothetical protein [Oscillospiraceae bacterium]